MMQFNMYHHYTVDEHLLRTIGELSAIEKGAIKDEVPLATELFPGIQNRKVITSRPSCTTSLRAGWRIIRWLYGGG